MVLAATLLVVVSRATGDRSAGRAARGVAALSARVPRFGMAVVRGDSMRPTLLPGDRLLIRYDVAPRAGDVVVARFADGTVVVKRATELRRTGWWLVGDAAPIGIDSRHRGPVPEERVLAVVRARIWPRPARRLPAPSADTAPGE